MKDKCPLVIVEWVDSSQPQANWSFLDELPELQVVECASVGWLVHQSADVIGLAPNMGNTRADQDSVQTSGLMTIPTRCVLKITCLDEASSLGGFPEQMQPVA